MKKLYLIFIVLFIPGISTKAQIIHVPSDQPTIQAGIDAAVDGDTVLVNPGMYVESINFNGKNISLGSLYILTQDTSCISSTIIDGNAIDVVVRFENEEDSTAIIEGFTISNAGHGGLGAILCSNANSTLRNLNIANNPCSGIYQHKSGAKVQQVNIFNNHTDYYGGGIVCYSSNPTLLNVVIMNNSAGYSGGGVYLEDSEPILQNVKISNNSAKYGGGGLHFYASTPLLKNVSIINNQATDDNARGGGIYCSNSTLNFDSANRCNIYSNSASKGNDLYSGSPQEVIVDTFTVSLPKAFHATPFEYFTFDIINGKYQQAEADLYVSPNGNNENSGLTVDNPLKTIRHAMSIILADSMNPRTIHLLDGLYSQESNGEMFPITLTDYISLKGTSENNVIVDGGGMSSVIEIENNHSSSVLHITITGGERGILVINSEPLIENIILTNNSANGVYCMNADPMINYVKVFGNGTGIYCNNSSPEIQNVEITKNIGRGIICEESSNPFLKDILISENSDGGVSCDNSNPTFQGVMILNNNAFYGGGIYCLNSDPVLEDVFIAYNSAEQGGGLYNCAYNNIGPVFDSIGRCNIYLNSARQGNDLYTITRLHVIVDTFSVLVPTDFHACHLDSIVFDIQHSKIQQVNADIFVSPTGDDENCGLTAEEPLKTLHHALTFMVADSANPHTIYLSEGIYSPSTTEELFPVNLTNYISLQGGLSDSVILDAEGSACVIRVVNNAETSISGLTITGGGGNTPNGGGIECRNSKLNVQDVIIDDNVAFGHMGEHGSGGGIFCFNSNITINHVVVSNNVAMMDWWPSWSDGGGIFIKDSRATLQDVVISGNGAFSGFGGGIKCVNSLTFLQNITISDNYATFGGGIACGDSTTLESVEITDNKAMGGGDEMSGPGEGGGIRIWGSPGLKDVTIHNNESDYGGGIYISGTPVLENVSIRNNKADVGGGIYNFENSQPDFDKSNRCDLYLNEAFQGNDLYSESLLEVIVDTFSVRYPTDYFASPLHKFTFDINFGLIEQINADIYISPGGNNDNTGSSEENPLKNIGYAFSRILVDSLNPHTIHLLEGIYSPSTNGELYPLNIPDFIQLSGISENNVILDAEKESSVLCINDNRLTTLTSFTIRGGGTGIYCSNSSPNLRNLTISNNMASGIYLAGSNAVLTDLNIINNSANKGGGIYCNNSNPYLQDVEINNNLADGGGGGISVLYDSYPKLQNVLILHNEARSGGGIYCSGSVIDLLNVTMADNIAELDAGSLYSEYSEVFLTNSILWNNEPYEIFFEADTHIPILDSLWIAWSDVKGGKEDIIHHNGAAIKWKDGNINEDPLFVGTGYHPWDLSAFSPCIDAGTPDTSGLFLPPYDLAGNPRIWNGRVDMGAYEWNNVGVGALQVAGCKLQVYPNPSCGISDIRYQISDLGFELAMGNGQLANEAKVLIEVFDLHGRKITTLVDEEQKAGDYEVRFNGSELPTGVYLIKLQVGKIVHTEKLLLIKDKR